METTSPENRPPRSPNYFLTVVAVIVAFLLGIFVGLHPSWIPLHTSGPAVPDMPSMSASPDVETHDRDQPTTEPQTQPATAPAAGG